MQLRFRGIPFAALHLSFISNITKQPREQWVCVIVWQDMRNTRKKWFEPGTHVVWTWGEQTAHGVIRKVFTHRIERTMKGATVTRAADKKNPAYLIEQDDGDQLLKNHSELKAA